MRGWVRVAESGRVWLAAVAAFVGFGVCVGPARAVTFTQQTLASSGLRQPQSVVVDGSGNVFVADAPPARVVELPASGPQQTLPFTGLSATLGVAVDGTGDVFASDTRNDRVVELPAGGTQQTLPFSGLTAPADVAADAAGDVFVADAATRRVIELPAGGSQETLPFSGLTDPEAVAVDGAGDVFVADTGNSRVVELPAGGSQQTLPSSGLNGPEGIAVDGAGDVFVADTGNNRVVELPAGGSQQTLPFSGLNDPQGVAVDLAGNVFVADTGNGRVVRLSPSLTSGSFGVSPATGPAGSSIGLASVTPCTLFSGGAFAATEAKLLLYSSTGQLLESATATFGDLGSWAGSLPVPAGAVNGTTYVVRARCTDFAGVLSQAYRPATFTVQAPAAGKLGQTRSAAPKLIGQKSDCGATTKARSRRTCTYTFIYAAPTGKNLPAIATGKIDGRRQVIARGRVRHHKLTLVFRHLRRGRYTLTLIALKAHGKRLVIGRTTIAIS
jgi:sugar lactone lactonase YvrE